ncbi:MAG TPA: response regulator [Polyangia bacterium]|jgi:CheY-like chemotaxis protein
MSLRNPPILYVDDEEPNVANFRCCFGDTFPVLTAPSAAAALAILATEPVAVLLADQGMPGMTGAELCAVVFERYPETVRLLVTADSEPEEAAAAAINAGHVSHRIPKPWRERQLRPILQEALDAHELGLLLPALHVDELRREQHAFVQRALFGAGGGATDLFGAARGRFDAIAGVVDRLAGDAAPPASRPEDLAGLREAALAGRAACEQGLARLEAVGRVAPTPRRMPAAVSLPVVTRAALTRARSAVEARAQVELELGRVPRVFAPPAELAGIIMALVLAVADAIPPPFPHGRQLTLRTGAEDATVVLQIRGTGAALPPAREAALLDPPPSGAGLRARVAALGGTVGVTREAGRGDALVLRLPALRG